MASRSSEKLIPDSSEHNATSESSLLLLREHQMIFFFALFRLNFLFLFFW